jgi:hypothetical protein
MTSDDRLQLRDLPAQDVAFEGARGSYLDADGLLVRVRSWTVTRGCAADGPSSLVFVDPPVADPETAGGRRFEVWVPVRAGATTTPDDPVQIKQVPGTRAAVLPVTTPYDPLQAPDLVAAAEAAAAARGLQRTGPARLIYEQDPARVSRPEDLTLELALPVA